MYAHQQKHEPCNTLLVVFYGRKREIKHWRRKREFRRFNEPGPRAPGGPESGAKNFMQEKNTKSIRTLGVGGIHCFPDPIAGRRAPKPHLCSQHFVFPVLALGGRRRELSAPRLLLNQGRSEPCYTTEIKEAGWECLNVRLVAEYLKFHTIWSGWAQQRKTTPLFNVNKRLINFGILQLYINCMQNNSPSEYDCLTTYHCFSYCLLQRLITDVYCSVCCSL